MSRSVRLDYDKLREHQPIKGQLEFPFQVECPQCNTPHGAHQHWCDNAKLTERQRMMS